MIGDLFTRSQQLGGLVFDVNCGSKITNMRLLFTAFLCCVSFSLQSQCIEGNCENGMGKFKFEDGSVYQGKFRNYSPHSINANAKIFYSNGDIYSGKFHDGQRFG